MTEITPFQTILDYLKGEPIDWTVFTTYPNAREIAIHITDIKGKYCQLKNQYETLKKEYAILKNKNTKGNDQLYTPTKNKISPVPSWNIMKNKLKNNEIATLRDLNLNGKSIEFLYKIMAVSNLTAAIEIPKYNVDIQSTDIGKEFISTFFPSVSEAYTWLEAMITRVMIESLAKNILVDNTNPDYSEVIAILRSLKNNGPPPEYQPMSSFAENLFILVDKIIDAIMHLNLKDEWFLYYIQSKGNLLLKTVLLTVVGHLETIESSVLEQQVNAANYNDLRYPLFKLLLTIAYSLDIQLPDTFRNIDETYSMKSFLRAPQTNSGNALGHESYSTLEEENESLRNQLHTILDLMFKTTTTTISSAASSH